jgi:hypothetical protein
MTYTTTVQSRTSNMPINNCRNEKPHWYACQRVSQKSPS